MKHTLLLTIILTLGVATCYAQTNINSKGRRIGEPNTLLVESATLANNDHTKWILRSLQKIEKMKVGMTRADLLKIFEEEGGLSTNSNRTYVFRECFYIKVDVEFKTVGDTTKDMNGLGRVNVEHNEDVITKISKPYLGRIILD